MNICSGPKCSRPVDSKGLCTAHYGQQWRGEELRPVYTTFEGKFMSKVNLRGGLSEHCPELGECWLWTGSKGGKYGNLTRNKKQEYAHRMAYELDGGHIPEGYEVDHLCFRPICVNPDHLEPVTHSENILRMIGSKVYRDEKGKFRKIARTA